VFHGLVTREAAYYLKSEYSVVCYETTGCLAHYSNVSEYCELWPEPVKPGETVVSQ
jgi:hypothetical protein